MDISSVTARVKKIGAGKGDIISAVRIGERYVVPKLQAERRPKPNRKSFPSIVKSPGRSADRERAARVAADKSREESEANFQKAVQATELVSEELARGIRPIAGTQSKTVTEILERAEKIYDDQLAGPNPPARVLWNKAKLLILVSEVYRTMSRLDESLGRGNRAIEICRGLVDAEASNRSYRITLGHALHRTAWTESDIGYQLKALDHFGEAIRLFDELGVSAETDPEETYTLASCLTISGNARVDRGQMNAARPLYERGLKLREELYAKAPTPKNAAQLAISCERIGFFYAKLNQSAQKIAVFEAGHGTPLRGRGVGSRQSGIRRAFHPQFVILGASRIGDRPHRRAWPHPASLGTVRDVRQERSG